MFCIIKPRQEPVRDAICSADIIGTALPRFFISFCCPSFCYLSVIFLLQLSVFCHCSPVICSLCCSPVICSLCWSPDICSLCHARRSSAPTFR